MNFWSASNLRVNQVGAPVMAPCSTGAATTNDMHGDDVRQLRHVPARRAHDSGGYAVANGSNQRMGLDNTLYPRAGGDL